MPAIASGIKNDDSPVRLKLREQTVSATSNVTPSPYNLSEGVSFKCLPYLEEVATPRDAIR